MMLQLPMAKHMLSSCVGHALHIIKETNAKSMVRASLSGSVGIAVALRPSFAGAQRICVADAMRSGS